VLEAAEKAQAISGQMPNFRRFHLNLWTESAESWITRDVWDQGLALAPFDAASLYGQKAWVALDLSNKVDTTAIVIAVPKDGLVYLISYVFLPSGPKGFVARAQAEKREYIGCVTGLAGGASGWRDRRCPDHRAAGMDQGKVRHSGSGL
jgi:phage terminase large subunit-like protein